ncbi:peptidase G2 autoproteolytic cleavage domain-containing protein [Providencia hangzhouensis]|uniref:peptidase G2 autoproteolytic cleavage domain-containing protein n=1 Tax=Providencia hangzhouensis TaxID=3031799 RepID=UPI0034DD0783
MKFAAGTVVRQVKTSHRLIENGRWDSSNGNACAAGAIVQGVSFSDYAEYFENAEYGVIPLGTIVELLEIRLLQQMAMVLLV